MPESSKIGLSLTVEVAMEETIAHIRAGAFARGIGSALVTGPGQSLTELAQRAGALRWVWEEAT
jgi:hypothetical protein